MKIIKPLQLGVLHRNFCWQKKQVFCVTVPIAFNLSTGDIMLEQDMWRVLGEYLEFHGFDSGMPKGAHEVLVVGNCIADEPVKTSQVNITVKRDSAANAEPIIDKTIVVTGHREWLGDYCGPVQPFTSLPIAYQYAYGGEGEVSNPAGCGVAGSDKPPNLAYPTDPFTSQGNPVAPAALCPIDFTAQQRLGYAGTYDQAYIDEVMPDLANDADLHYFNDGLKDQWLPTPWTGDELISITNMNQQQQTIQCQLPPIYARTFIKQLQGQIIPGGEPASDAKIVEIPMALDTVWLCPNDDMGIMLYRGTTEAFHCDGLDVESLLLACENRHDAPRTREHYCQQLKLRTCPDNGFKYALYSQPLIAENMSCAFEQMLGSAEHSLEMFQKRNIDAYTAAQKTDVMAQVETEKQAVRDKLIAQGIDPEPYLNPDDKKFQQQTQKQIDDLTQRIAPPLEDGSGKIDITNIDLDAMDEIAVLMGKLKAETSKQAEDEINKQLLQLESEADSEYKDQKRDALLDALKALDPVTTWPRFNIDTELEGIKQQAANYDKGVEELRSMGVSDDKIPELDIDFADLEQRLTQGMANMKAVYANGAHLIEDAVSPHEGQEEALRQAIVTALSAGTCIANNDYACVDFSGLDLSGVDLSGCYLESAVFRDCDLSNTNFSHGVVVSAIFERCKFHNTQLHGANFGRCCFKNTEFTDCDLQHTELQFSEYSCVTFTACAFAPFNAIDGVFQSVKWQDCQFPTSNFVNVTWHDCHLTRCILTTSNFVDSHFVNVTFDDCDLSGVNLVNLEGDGTVFLQGNLDNVRFVGGCQLAHSQYRHLRLNAASFRESILTNACFEHVALVQADFSLSNLKGARISHCNMTRSLFNGAYLKGADMTASNMMEVSLYGAYISDSVFNQSNLYSANFVRSTLGDNSFLGANLDRSTLADWRP